MNNKIIDTCDALNPLVPQAKITYRKCDKCGQIICNTEFIGSVFVADKCPKCGIDFVDTKTHINNEIVRHALKNTFKQFEN